MKNAIKKSDFVLVPYMKSNNLKATYQILNTVIPYIFLWFLAFKAAAISVLLLPPIIVLMTLFSGRCFSLMHDCGHYSLFSSKKVNRSVGFLLGIINAIPQYPWSRGHAYHHKHNGNWDMYRGPSALISTEKFAALSTFGQKMYQFLRHPLMLFPGGFFYLIIKPRLALVLGIAGFFRHTFACLVQDWGMGLPAIVASYKLNIGIRRLSFGIYYSTIFVLLVAGFILAIYLGLVFSGVFTQLS